MQTGFSIYDELSKKNPNAPLAEESSRINEAANKFIVPFTNPNKWTLDLPGMATQSIDFGLGAAPRINQFNMSTLLQMMNQAMPGWQQAISQMTANNADLLAGKVPQDVVDQITRSSAYQALTSGVGGGGAGTGMQGKTITARDLGLTSLDLTSKGQTQSLQEMGFARNYLMPQPVNPLSLLPLSDLLSATEWSKTATYNANLQAFVAKSNAAAAQAGAPQQSVLGGIGGAIGGLASSLGKTNPQTGQSGFSMLGNLFGGGGGSGGSFGGMSSPSSAESGMSMGSMLGMFGA